MTVYFTSFYVQPLSRMRDGSRQNSDNKRSSTNLLVQEGKQTFNRSLFRVPDGRSLSYRMETRRIEDKPQFGHVSRKKTIYLFFWDSLFACFFRSSFLFLFVVITVNVASRKLHDTRKNIVPIGHYHFRDDVRAFASSLTRRDHDLSACTRFSTSNLYR